MSTVKGKIHEVLQLESFDSGFQKQSLIVETEDTYPQFINIEFLKDKTELLNNLKKGDNVDVSYNLNGRPWTSPQGEIKYFNSITGWKIEKVGSEVNTQQTQPKKEKEVDVFAEESDDLPF